MARDDPETCWRFIEVARDAELADEDLAYVAAGAFEDLMSYHGDRLLERVEAVARKDAMMCFLLATVWRGGMSAATWERVESLRRRFGIEPH